ncbi:tetratricopeptide repeat protein [Paenibacillus ginsengarvi]|uniref:Nuclease PIN n=1 Tax=Paenibacillus ginsengarvi TaxID=400777 RepID=A0A3B0CKS6_9BACL|nr:tetratricopeptide repeat protein [Paenibacillus ginsengarvi]RKN84937.1 nuclease PIN [Paenibacillus ginsengarvi]
MKLSNSRRILALLVLMLAASALLPLAAFAEVPYWTNSKEKQGRLIWTQPAYTPEGIFGKDLAIPDKDKPGELKSSPLQNPKDLFVDKNDHIYVADTGNSRIVEFSPAGEFIRFIAPDKEAMKGLAFNKPEGVFVTDNLDIYVADTGNKRVVRLDKDGKFIQAYGKPESKYIPESFKYDPTRLVVDKRGFLYIAVLGGYQGLLQLDPDGEFQSFYGANKTIFSPLDAMKRLLYTKQMYANEISKLPGAISSVAVDHDGFMYTTTAGQGIKNEQIKKLSIKGLNLMEDKVFGEVRRMEIKFATGGQVTPQLIDIAIDSNGNMTAIDSSYKYINQYDANGNLLFFWAGPSSANTTQLGLMKNPVAVDANSRNDLFLLDGQEGVIQLFRLSEFGNKVNEANKLTLQGRYEESESHWREVLRLNANFAPAVLGLAKAAYKQGNYEEALELFKRGDDHKGYSDAFWQIRLKWFQKNFSLFASSLVILVILYFVLEKATRKTKWRKAWRARKRSTNQFIVQFKHMFYMLKRPIDGFTALRFESKGGYRGALILLVLAATSLIVLKLFTSFSFNMVDIRRVNLIGLLIQYALVWLGWVVANYLVSSIYRGEGRFKDVFVGSAYALIPLILVGIPLAIISNGMTLSEQAIYDFLQNVLYVWTGLMIFWKIQALQNYTVGETIMNIFLTLVAFATLAILALVIIGLSSDLKDFIYEVYQEVRMR